MPILPISLNEEDWPLRGSSCYGEAPPPNSGQTLNPEFSAERNLFDTDIYWIIRLEAFGLILEDFEIKE